VKLAPNRGERPSEDELRAFVELRLSNLDKELREPP
jgi:hypothetical protein